MENCLRGKRAIVKRIIFKKLKSIRFTNIIKGKRN